MSILSKPYMYDEAAAFEHVEGILWPDGPVCPHCGNCGKVYELKGVRTKPSKKNPEGKERHGLKKCGECRKQFTVRIGTIFEESHIELHKWLQAIHLMVSSKKGISSHQLHRVLEVTYKTAWFLTHRIRECMRTGDLEPFGGNGGEVEIDETYIGKEREKPKKARGPAHKMKIMTLVDRETRQAKSIVIDDLKQTTFRRVISENMSQEAVMITDEWRGYRHIADEVSAEHHTVNHSKGEYGRGTIHTNTVEGYYSIFKRGMKGVYQHCGKQHLHRYAAEFDFRYNNRAALDVDDTNRAATALLGVVGKRLSYRC
jgi:transposase-like protein